MVTRQQELMEEENFYHTLDKETRGSCCSCYTFTIFFLGLFIIVAAITYFVAKYLSSRPTAPNSTPTPAPTMTISPSISPSPIFRELTSSGKTRLIITEAELQNIIWSGPQLLLPLVDKTARVENDGLVLSGTIPGLSTQVSMVLKPKVQKNNIIISEAVLRQGPREFGDEFFGVIKDKVGQMLTQTVKKKTKAKITQLTTESGRLILE